MNRLSLGYSAKNPSETSVDWKVPINQKKKDQVLELALVQIINPHQSLARWFQPFQSNERLEVLLSPKAVLFLFFFGGPGKGLDGSVGGGGDAA